jgi:hypothetical protein
MLEQNAEACCLQKHQTDNLAIANDVLPDYRFGLLLGSTISLSQSEVIT